MQDFRLGSFRVWLIAFYLEKEGLGKEVFEGLEMRDLLSLEDDMRFFDGKCCWVVEKSFFKDDYFYFWGLLPWILWIDYLDFITVNDFFSFDSALGLENKSFFD